MNKIYFSTLFAVMTIFCSQPLYAHGGGGSSYDFDANNRAADHAEKREAEKKLAERKSDEDDWAEFMEAVNKPEKEKEGEKHQDHNHNNRLLDKL